jgi:hypothetical protein
VSVGRDDGTRSDDHANTENGVGRDNSAMVNAGGLYGLGEQLRGSCKPEARLFAFDDGFGAWIRGDDAGMEHDDSSVSSKGCGGGCRGVSEDKIKSTGALAGVDCVDFPLGITLGEFAAQLFDQFT